MPRLRQVASCGHEGGGGEEGDDDALPGAKRAAVSPSRRRAPWRFESFLAVFLATPRARDRAPAGDLAAMWMWWCSLGSQGAGG